MGKFVANKVGIEGLLVIEPKIFGDKRGYFFESYNKKEFSELGLNVEFVQDNQSMSSKGVLRGLHYQKQFPQGKLVRVTQGKVFDVAVDIRKNSDTFGKWFGIELSDENQKQFYIPEGFAHGFLVLSDIAVFQYKVTDYYHPNDEGGIIWNDKDIDIKWPELSNENELIDGTKLIFSEKDKDWETFIDFSNRVE